MREEKWKEGKYSHLTLSLLFFLDSRKDEKAGILFIIFFLLLLFFFSRLYLFGDDNFCGGSVRPVHLCCSGRRPSHSKVIATYYTKSRHDRHFCIVFILMMMVRLCPEFDVRPGLCFVLE